MSQESPVVGTQQPVLSAQCPRPSGGLAGASRGDRRGAGTAGDAGRRRRRLHATKRARRGGPRGVRCLRHRRRRKRARCLAQAKGGAARTLLRLHSVASCHVQVDAEVARKRCTAKVLIVFYILNLIYAGALVHVRTWIHFLHGENARFSRPPHACLSRCRGAGTSSTQNS